MKLPGKVLKYFKPATADRLYQPIIASGDDMEESFGYFALQKRSDALLLNRFNADTVLLMMERVGLVDHLNALGFNGLQVEIKRDEAQINHLKVYHEMMEPENLLINLRLSRSRLVPEERFFEKKMIPVLDMVMIEWLSAEDPRGEFSEKRPQLPGQLKPGLGSLSYLMDLIYIAGKILLVDGFLDVPNYFHGAVMYSRKFKFFDPVQEAELKAILRDLEARSLDELSWGMLTGSITESITGRPCLYTPSEQVFPISSSLEKYFSSEKYRQVFNETYRSRQYHLDYEAMLQRKEKLLQEKRIEEL
ncbi:MAG: hypothetical protein GX883_01890 [Firmicutes bacterium]|nr:hypothetical protein [Bacillota bacterium]